MSKGLKAKWRAFRNRVLRQRPHCNIDSLTPDDMAKAADVLKRVAAQGRWSPSEVAALNSATEQFEKRRQSRDSQ